MKTEKPATMFDRIKRWLARPLTIRKLPSNYRQHTDTVQWVYCASSRDCCPVFPDDTNLIAARLGPTRLEEGPC